MKESWTDDDALNNNTGRIQKSLYRQNLAGQELEAGAQISLKSNRNGF